MRFTEKVEKVITVDEPRGVVCNCCGEAFEPNHADATQQITLAFGYGSEFANNNPWKFDLCETCLIKLIKTFKYVPENFKCEPQFFKSAYDVDPDLHQQLFENWKLTGEWYDDDKDNPWKKNYSEKLSEDSLDELFEDSKPSPQTTLKVIK